MPRNPILKSFHIQIAPAFLFAALFLPPAEGIAAPLPVEKDTYSLTFPDGWVSLPVQSGAEGSFQVYNPELGDEVAAFGYGIPTTAALPPTLWIDTYTQALIGEFARTDSSEKKLGDYDFKTSEFKDTTEDGNPDTRIRIYIATQGDFLFLSWLTYSVGDGDPVVTEFETALTTLQIDASAPIVRRARMPGAVGNQGPRLDVLGRNWNPAGDRAPRIPVFTRP